MKFEIGRRLFENFRKLEDGVSKFSNIPIFGRNQMNEPIGKLEDRFSKFLKIGKAIFQNLEYSKNWKQTNK